MLEESVNYENSNRKKIYAFKSWAYDKINKTGNL